MLMKTNFYRLGIVLSCIWMLISCNSGKSESESLIPDDKLLNVLVDLHIAEGATQRFSTQEQDSVKNMFLTQILEIHHIRKGQIDSTLEKLYQQPERYQAMQSSVLDSMRNLEKKIKGEI